MNDKIFLKLKSFINNQSGIDVDDLTRETRIQHDLGIYGDDAIEFIIAYGKEFNVNIKNFMAADYFSPEGDSILSAIIRLFTSKKKKKIKELTIGNLENAIVAGRLDEDSIALGNSNR